MKEKTPYYRNCPSCNKIIYHKSKECLIKQSNIKCLCYTCGHKINRVSKYSKNCPICNKILYYDKEKNLKVSIKNNTKCRTCAHTGKIPSPETLIKLKNRWKIYNHPMKGKTHSIETRIKISQKTMGRKVSEHIKNRYKKIFKGSGNPNYGNGNKIMGSKNHFYGKKHSDESLEKMRKPKLGKKWTEEQRTKRRQWLLDRCKKYGTSSFNPKACKFLDEYGKNNGYNIRHAMNGGEVEIFGYRVDGYDKEKNIIFEYDEPRHESKFFKIKDVKRQENLLKYLKCKMIRYSEKYNKIYEVDIGKSIII